MDQPKPVQTLEYASPHTEARPLVGCYVFGAFEFLIAGLAAWLALASVNETALISLGSVAACVVALVLAIILLNWRRARRAAALGLAYGMILLSMLPIVLGIILMSEASSGGWLAGLVMMIGLFFFVMGIGVAGMHVGMIVYLKRPAVAARFGSGRLQMN